MKEFLGYWIFGTAFFTSCVYVLGFILAGALAFAGWDITPVVKLVHSLDWFSFRLIIILSAFVSFFIALVEVSD